MTPIMITVELETLVGISTIAGVAATIVVLVLKAHRNNIKKHVEVDAKVEAHDKELIEINQKMAKMKAEQRERWEKLESQITRIEENNQKTHLFINDKVNDMKSSLETKVGDINSGIARLDGFLLGLSKRDKEKDN